MPRLACIGAGAWGRHLVRNFVDLGALACVCDTSPQALDEVRARHPRVQTTRDVERVFADSSQDAVIIATPAETHGDLVRRALVAGKDVFVEKPLCLSLDEAKSLVELAEARNRILMVGHLLWYHPAILALDDLVRDGKLGRIQYVYSNRLNLGRVRREENILWSFAPHDISVILGLVKEMPAHVTAHGGSYLQKQIVDVTVSTLSFASGIRAHIFVSWLHPFKEQKLVVVGDRQMAVFDDMETHDKLVLYPHTIDVEHDTPVTIKAAGIRVPLNRVEPLRAECEHFLECVEHRKTPRTDGHEAIRVLSVLQRCEESLRGSGND
jgi:UDP-2-acetamido-3-amino-2,3-dideoxy-glucuronate N-acetyltransferase